MKNLPSLLKISTEPNLFYMHQQHLVPEHGAKYEDNQFSHHGEMHEDGQTDGWTRPIPIFPNSVIGGLAGNKFINENILADFCYNKILLNFPPSNKMYRGCIKCCP